MWMRFLAIWLASSCLLAASAQDTTQKVVAGRRNSLEQQKKPYVILISSDGFRYDLAEKYHASNLLELRDQGVYADYMQPAFPSLTFPNHYSLATGLYPAHHGIVDNVFFDPKKRSLYSLGNHQVVGDSSWYGGTPLWVLAERHQMLSACFYWVGSESAIQGIRPTYYYVYNDLIHMDRRLDILKDWLQLPEEKRPHFIAFYLPQPDHDEHRFGPDSKQAEQAVQFVDASVGKMVRMIDSLGLAVNFIFLSDHGMTSVDTVNTLELPAAVDTNKFLVLPGLTLVHLYAKDQSSVQPAFEALRQESKGKPYDVYLTQELPARWHYGKPDDSLGRTGDILLVPHEHIVFNIYHRRVPAGEHGYDPQLDLMHACFYAWGPAFKEHKHINGFQNVNVYPLIAHILSLDYVERIDGNLRVLQSILKR
jgi:predicted AlkP superfamily pyrophosphatase or phosphodiesterase